MLKPEFEEVELGTAEIREIFRSSKFGNIAGSIVRSGEIKRGTRARITRNGVVVSENVEIAGLRRFKDDVTEVREGFECGINLGSFNDLAARRPHRHLRDAREAARLSAAGPTAPAPTGVGAVAVRRVPTRPADAGPGMPCAPAPLLGWSPRRPARTGPTARHTKAEVVMADPARARKIADRIKVIVAEYLEFRLKDDRLGLRHHHRRPGHRRPAARLGLLHRLRRRRGPSGHGRRARGQQGPHPLGGRQADRHPADAVARVHRRRAARGRGAPRGPRGADAGPRRGAGPGRGRTPSTPATPTRTRSPSTAPRAATTPTAPRTTPRTTPTDNAEVDADVDAR